jgi:hypothetical protein
MHGMRSSASDNGTLAQIQPGLPLLRSEIFASSYPLTADGGTHGEMARAHSGHVVRAGSQQRRTVGAGRGGLIAPHAGYSIGIRAPEAGETAPNWEEVMSYLRIGAHEWGAS